MQKKKITFKHRIEYLFFIAFILLVKMSPVFLLKFNKRLLNFLARRLDKRHFGTVKKNLAIAFPHHTEAENLKLREDIYRHFSSIFVEIIFLFMKRKPERILKKIEVNNIEIITKALAQNKGVLMFSAHFGNWELIPYILSPMVNMRLAVIARELDNPLIEQKVLRFREKMGSDVIYKKNAVRSVLKNLEENRLVCMLIDQNTIEREAVFVDFFNNPAGTVPTIARIHLKKECPVIPFFLHYEEDRIVLDMLEEVRFKPTGNMENDIRQLTQECTSIIETFVRKYPEQWLWFHDRWRTQPTNNRSEQ
jgi:KDO2-lipid IV(A) lauroyltransferase